MATAVIITLAVILGASFGSFFNVVADRLPQGQSLVSPPSHCPSCGRRLSPVELIPILSYLWLRGRCLSCKAPIPRRIFFMELGCGLVFALAAWKYGFNPHSLLLGLYCSFFITLAVIDLEQGIIPNLLTYPAMLVTLILAPFWHKLGFPHHFLSHTSPQWLLLGSFVSGIIGGMVFLIPLLIYPEGMGWGDVKLGALIGLVTGFPAVIVAILVALLSGGLVAIFLVLTRRRGRKETIPFAPFLSLGALVALGWGEQLLHWYLGLFWL